MFILSILFFGLYLLVRQRRGLHLLQLNSYRNERYGQWLSQNLPKLISAVYVLAFVGVVLLMTGWKLAGLAVWSGLLLLESYRIWRIKEKKKLVFTPRAKRVFLTVQVLLLLGILLQLFFVPEQFLHLGLWLTGLISPLWLLAANFLITPVEKRINQWYVKDAKRILRSMPQLKIIGITGSYGKTSTKHYLEKILAQKYNVLITPGSYNTPMGVTITTRNSLKPYHQVFIVEMGAKQVGDIQEICDIVNPQIGIITAVADQHLDTFGSLENVQRTKMELAEAVPADGHTFLNRDYPMIQDYTWKQPKPHTFYSVHQNENGLSAGPIEYTSRGIAFTVYRDGEALFDLKTKLLGEHNVSNILAAVGVALYLDVEPSAVQFAVRKLEPVEHRLAIKLHPNGVTVIDDAFNSNPAGAAMALDVLKRIEGARKIIITPGMIELGDKAYAYNKTFGQQIAATCDYVVLVGPKQTRPIQDGLAASHFPKERIFIAKNLTEANQHIGPTLRQGDVVLYENDLPDTYEAT